MHKFDLSTYTHVFLENSSSHFGTIRLKTTFFNSIFCITIRVDTFHLVLCYYFY